MLLFLRQNCTQNVTCFCVHSNNEVLLILTTLPSFPLPLTPPSSSHPLPLPLTPSLFLSPSSSHLSLFLSPPPSFSPPLPIPLTPSLSTLFSVVLCHHIDTYHLRGGASTPRYSYTLKPSHPLCHHFQPPLTRPCKYGLALSLNSHAPSFRQFFKMVTAWSMRG